MSTIRHQARRIIGRNQLGRRHDRMRQSDRAGEFGDRLLLHALLEMKAEQQIEADAHP
jgi:hypothetical protein